VAYEKQGVLSTQLQGGPDGYAMTPLLVEYIVTWTKHLSLKINHQLQNQPDFQLSSTQQTNKLAVCLGNGSKYDKHIDNLGGGTGGGADGADERKLTALLYLQPVGSHAENADLAETLDERGGYFRAYDVPHKDNVKSLAPRGDRLLLFWSDALVHDVSPSFCLDDDNDESKNDERWALTIWFLVDKGGVIRETNAEIEQRHFGNG
jgi:Rps23 Pro-64 3,4-dihydroxylase Tpa1-like proline 4-hydroxylase